MNFFNSHFRRAARARWRLAAGSVAAFGALGSSGALAQSCGDLTLHGTISGDGLSTPYAAGGTIGALGSGVSAGGAVLSAVTAANTAFLTQSTAFVSAPGNPPANSEGAGVWMREVGGDLNLKSSTQVGGTLGSASAGGITLGQGTGATQCNSTFHQTFAGFQVGQDVARLNIGNGWNLHLGTTAGFLETSGNITQGNVTGGAFNSTTEAPFLGTYGVLTKGDFYIDGLLRYDYFETDMNSPTANIFDQKVDAHGWTLAASTGYNYKVPNSKWFVEPSLGVVWSKESVGAINTASPLPTSATNNPLLFRNFFPSGNYSGTTQIDDIDTLIGRFGVRVGTVVETGNLVLQPFVAASVWHDFSGDITAHYSSCPNCFAISGAAAPGGGIPTTLTASLTTNNVGTFGQYSLGISGQVVNTGWLGFARVDYREGPNMNGFSGTGGIRYQFTPGQAPAYPVKAPVYKAPDVINWAGLYVGGIGGVESGRSDMYFPALAAANLRPAGVLGGGTLGYNWQLGHWVYGIEGDAVGTPVRGSGQCAPLNPAFGVNFPLFQTTCHNEIDWTATVAGRLGYVLLPHTLMYGKAGVAIAEESFSETCNLGPINGSNGALVKPLSPIFVSFQNCVNSNAAFVNAASANALALGWTLGYGVEFAFTQHWTAKAEFDWLDFGHKSVTLSDGTAINTYERAAQAKVGVNYKF
jgi:outer membrane autotransporter protein